MTGESEMRDEDEDCELRRDSAICMIPDILCANAWIDPSAKLEHFYFTYFSREDMRNF
jgi:hypothetical protein